MEDIRLPAHIQTLLACWKDFSDRYADLPPPLPVVEVKLRLDELAALQSYADEQLNWLRDWKRRFEWWATHQLAVQIRQPDTPEQVMRRTCAKLGDFADQLACQRKTFQVHFQNGATGMSAVATRVDAVCHALLRKLLDFVADIEAALTPEALAAATRQDGRLELEFTLSLGCDEGIEQLGQWLEAQQKAANFQEFSAADWLFMAVVLIGGFLFLARFGSEGISYLILAVLAIAALVFIIRNPLAVLLAIVFGIAIGS